MDMDMDMDGIYHIICRLAEAGAAGTITPHRFTLGRRPRLSYVVYRVQNFICRTFRPIELRQSSSTQTLHSNSVTTDSVTRQLRPVYERTGDALTSTVYFISPCLLTVYSQKGICKRLL